MPSIAAYPVLNFSGGIVRNKGLLEMQKNELLDARNIEIDEQGRLKVRRGSQQMGQTLSGGLENSFVFIRNDTSSTPTSQLRFLVNNNATTGVISLLSGGNRVTTAISVGDTSITLNSSTSFAASGTVEIEGDLIAYTSKSSATTLDGVTGITSAHAIGVAVHQWTTLTQSGTAVDGRAGITYAVLNNICFFAGRGANIKQYDGTTVTDVSSEPAVIMLETYRDKLFGVGDGSSGTNGDPRRVSFSNNGDGTTWTTGADFFDVEDSRGEFIVGIKNYKDRLGIFKLNSIFSYDEVELKKRIDGVGAFSHKNVQEVNGLLYTFCPSGIFETNLFESRNIGLPVREYWENFHPEYDTTFARVVTNTFSGKFKDLYILYIHDIENPTSLTDVTLVFDTVKRNWTTFQGAFTDFLHFGSFGNIDFGDTVLTSIPSLFGGNASSSYYRFFENKYLDGLSTQVLRGGDIFQDSVSDTGTVVSGMAETPLYDLTHPSLYKRFQKLKVYVERGEWHMEYRIENEDGISDYKTLGTANIKNRVLSFPRETRGWRVGFRLTSVSTHQTPIFNGFVFMDTLVDSRK